jgi:hypothetical protein
MVVCLRQFGQYKLTLYVFPGYDDASVRKRFLAFRDSLVFVPCIGDKSTKLSRNVGDQGDISQN